MKINYKTLIIVSLGVLAIVIAFTPKSGHSQSAPSFTIELPPTSTPHNNQTNEIQSTETTTIESPEFTPTQVAVVASPTPTAKEIFVPATRIPVLEYHNPSYHSGRARMRPEWFIEQIEWLADEGFYTPTGEEFLSYVLGEIELPQKSVVLRFDIGLPDYDEYAEIVIPSLRNHGFHALFYVVTPAITDDCTHPDNKICWGDLVKWENEGLITVGSHGVDHPNYREIEQSYMIWDAKTSKKIIEEKIGHEIDWFTYPFDSVPDNAEAIFSGLGYKAATAGARIERSVVPNDPNLFALPSYYPYSDESVYPNLTTSHKSGMTFQEMILDAISNN